MFIEIEHENIDDFTGKRVILFGAGSYGLHAMEEFEKRNVTILAFCDNNEAMSGKMMYGYKIIHPKELSNYQLDAIIITSTFFDEITEQLYNMGYHNVYTAKVGVLHKNILSEEFRNQMLTEEEANDYLFHRLTSKEPFMAGRLGSVELECIIHYQYFLNRNSSEGIQQEYPNNVKMMMETNAGFFPAKDELLDRFSRLYLENLEDTDLLWSMWLSFYEDKLYFEHFHKKLIAVYDDTYFPIHKKNPWTRALEGKRVLVIHPFEESIRCNYKKRNKLFNHQEFLPKFELITLKAVQSIAGTPVEYKDWFEALDHMQKTIDRIDFDIALVGAGAYGFSLAAYIKRIGKKSVHVGGALQLYFGIKGKAWNKLGIYNDYWTQPKDVERPSGYKQVEAGRYW